MTTRKKLTSLLLIFCVWLNFFASFAPAQIQVSNAPPQAERKGLQFRLREAQPEKRENPAPPVEIADLSKPEADAILRRLPQFSIDSDEKTDFALRPNSLPPPRTGRAFPVKFPAAETQPAPNLNQSNPAVLEVARFSPEGDVKLVAELAVTFSQPMIAVASQEMASENVPVKLTPPVKGKWRWLGTQTLIFDAAERFPMATKFTATVFAGTKSALGGSLPKDFSWTFTTPPVKVESFQPNGESVRRDAILLAVFNQEINAEAVLQKISATANGLRIPLRPATQDEIAADEKLSKKIKEILPKRWLAFRAVETFSPDSIINITFESGLPSAEGKLTTTAPQSFSFKTFGRLKFDKSYCGYDQDQTECQTYEDLKVRFNNLLDEESFDRSKIKIEPNIENAEFSVTGNKIEISGYKIPRKTYRVTVGSGAVKDEFGQTLDEKISAVFKIRPLESNLYAEKSGFVTLDPHARPTFSVYSTNYKNLKVRLYAARPEDYPAFQALQENGDKTALPAFGRLVYEKSVRIKSEFDVSEETRIDLTPALNDGFGHAVLIVEPPFLSREMWEERIVVWAQATQIGLDAFADDERLTVFASDLKTGRPLSDVRLSIFGGASGATGENGLADLELPPKVERNGGLLIARRGADAVILPENNLYGESEWQRRPAKDSLRWFVFDDRKMYRPGETVSVKGYVRRVAGGKFADVGELADAVGDLEYVLKDSRGNEILKGEASLNAFGAFDFQLKLPANLNLGSQRLELSAESELENKNFTHFFQAQEFRRPEFEVSARVETAAPFYIGGAGVVGVEAKYFSGGALPNAETNWKVTAEPTDYAPPGRDDFNFGKFVPWWERFYENDDEKTTSQEFKGKTGADGRHRVAIDFVAAGQNRAYKIKAEARVQDVNRQTFAASTQLLVHPAELYVGVRSPKNFVGAGERFKIETIATDIDGRAVAGAPVAVVAELKDWRRVKGQWQEITIDTQSCEIKSAAEIVSCEFDAKQGGVFLIKASVADRNGRHSESDLKIWVAGGSREPSREIEKEEARLIPDKKDYAPGEAAEILVNAPFAPAEGVLTLRRNGIVKTEHFTMNQATTVLKVPIEERFLPNVHLQVDLFGASPRVVFEDERDAKLPKRPAFASGELNLKVSTASRKLNVTAEPAAKTLEPGGATTINISVKDNNGNAVADSEVAVLAADESVLALTNYKIENPLDVFYPEIQEGTSDFHSRESVLLARPDETGFGFGDGIGSGSGSGRAGDNDSPPPPSKPIPAMVDDLKMQAFIQGPERPVSPDQIRLRTNFNALATFTPSVKTDAKGNAVVNVNLPDNLTRYRITAVAVTKSKHFGLGESSLTARQPLMARPSAPRFMNFGDKIELPVVLQNQTDEPMTVDVAIRAVNANLTAGNGRRITIAANDRAEIRFPVSADKAGVARFQVGAVAGRFSDAAEFFFPVYTPATTEAFATYGTTDQNGAIVQPIQAPAEVFPQFGGLEITTSSTQLQELTDAFIYLQNYPFECSEQISSRILSVAALRDVLAAFDAKDLPKKEQIEAKMKADIERLQKLQHADGGFSFWRSTDESVPFVSVHVAHALARAAQKGYAVPRETMAKSLEYLKNIESKYPRFYSPEARRAISAYALYARDLLGDRDAAKARNLLRAETIEKLSPESLGWILSVLAGDQNSSAEVDLIKRHLLNRVTETAGAAHFVADYKDGEYVLLASARRADGVILESLLKAEPNNGLIPKIARGLLAHRTKGRWRNTQENVFVLLALEKYFQVYEKTTPNFVARVWLGQAFAGEQKFNGRSTDSNLINVPMNFLQTNQPDSVSKLVFDKQGEGRLYYRIGIKYAPKNLQSGAADYGFTVARSYEAIDNPTDVRRNADGSWTIKAGARVRVRVQMVAPTRRYHVALVDRLPAGLEIINPNLSVSETVPTRKSDEPPPPAFGQGWNFYRSYWFDHQNLRDERVEAFASLLQAGVWDYSYPARATTPGFFVAPPATAEEMYAPETFGRGATDFVTIE